MLMCLVQESRFRASAEQAARDSKSVIAGLKEDISQVSL